MSAAYRPIQLYHATTKPASGPVPVYYGSKSHGKKSVPRADIRSLDRMPCWCTQEACHPFGFALAHGAMAAGTGGGARDRTPRRPAAALPTLPGSFRGTPHHQTEEQGPEFRTRPLVGSTVKAKNSELHRRSPNRMTCRPTWTCVLAQRARLKYLPWARLWSLVPRGAVKMLNKLLRLQRGADTTTRSM